MSTKVIRCKFCDKRCPSIDKYVEHIERSHKELIPQDMDAWRFAYMLKTGKTHGTCIICKQDTVWNPKTHKYNRLCDNKSCKDKYTEIFRQRMIGKYGKTTLLNDPEQQRIMLSKRKISGVYTWSDRVHTFSYTGTYELSFLEFLDNTLNFDPDDIMAPSPRTYYYTYEGKEHFYIPDFYIPSLNAEIEIKEGTNMHPKNLAVDKVKESLKDQVMKSLASSMNYLKIVEKDNEKFLFFIDEIKRNYFENDKRDGIIMT